MEWVSALASRWWSDLRFYWTVKDKTLLFLGLMIPIMFTGFGMFISNALNQRVENEQIRCLAMNIYHEARGEPLAGQFAVAEVTMNRVRSKHYPNSVCEVVYQRNWDQIRKRYVGMFSWTELDEQPRIKSRFWQQSVEVARRVYRDDYRPTLKGALFYHARQIRPSWIKNKKPKARIGNHIFY